MSTLLLIRHGQSQWNLENRFTGWTDVPLSAQGEKDAAAAGRSLSSAGLHFDLAFTSRLRRAGDTLAIILKTMKHKKIAIEQDSALNERHYGELQGLNKAETAAKYGEEQVQLWRRSYATRPPGGESIEDCERRTTPFFLQYILPQLASGKNVIVAAHGNSMRPIFKHLDQLDPDTTATLEVGLCLPYIYTFEDEKMVKKAVMAVPEIQATGTSDIHQAGK